MRARWKTAQESLHTHKRTHERARTRVHTLALSLSRARARTHARTQVDQLHSTEAPEHHILLFLTGEDEINRRV